MRIMLWLVIMIVELFMMILRFSFSVTLRLLMFRLNIGMSIVRLLRWLLKMSIIWFRLQLDVLTAMKNIRSNIFNILTLIRWYLLISFHHLSHILRVSSNSTILNRLISFYFILILSHIMISIDSKLPSLLLILMFFMLTHI